MRCLSSSPTKAIPSRLIGIDKHENSNSEFSYKSTLSPFYMQPFRNAGKELDGWKCTEIDKGM